MFHDARTETTAAGGAASAMRWAVGSMSTVRVWCAVMKARGRWYARAGQPVAEPPMAMQVTRVGSVARRRCMKAESTRTLSSSTTTLAIHGRAAARAAKTSCGSVVGVTRRRHARKDRQSVR